MRLARCERGHFYDKDKFTSCPHCTGMQVAPSETVAYEDPDAKKEEPVAPVKEPEPQKKVEVEDRIMFSSSQPVQETPEPAVAANEEEALDEMVTIRLNEQEAAVATEKVEQLQAEEEFVPHEEKREEEQEIVIEPEEVPASAVNTEPDWTEENKEPELEEDTVEIEEAESSKEEESALAEPEIPLDEAKTEEPVVVEEAEAAVEEAETVAAVAEEPVVSEEPEVVTEPESESKEETEAKPESENKEETEAKPQPFEAQKTPQEEEEKTTLKDTVASAVSSRIPDDITPEELNSNPVIGWLVAIKGAHKGRSYEVKQGRNFIGRSTAMDICLSGNSKISRDRHAIITYDPRSKKCFLQPDETRDLIYINDELLFGPMPMKHNDVIVLADEEFVFLALQCDKADWM